MAELDFQTFVEDWRFRIGFSGRGTTNYVSGSQIDFGEQALVYLTLIEGQISDSDETDLVDSTQHVLRHGREAGLLLRELRVEVGRLALALL